VRHAVEHAVAAPPAKPHVARHVVPGASAPIEHGVPAVVERPAVRPPAHAAAALHRWRHGRHLGAVRRSAVAVTPIPHGHVVAATHSRAGVAKAKPAAPVQSQRKSTVHAAVPTRASTTHVRTRLPKTKPVKPAKSAAPNRPVKAQSPSAVATAAPQQQNGGTPNGFANGHTDVAHGNSSH
jgi:hypothetical protein